MLTSEELFPPEHCFAHCGSCSSHPSVSPLTPLFPSLHLHSAPYSSCRFPPSYPPLPVSLFSSSSPHLLHGDIVLTRLGTCNLFVSRARPVARELHSVALHSLSLSRYALSSLLSAPLPAKSVLLVRNGALLCSRIRAASPPLHGVVMCSVASARNDFVFFFF